MFGRHSIPLSIEEGGISLSVAEADGTFRYRRVTGTEEVEKSLVFRPVPLLISPIEPLCTPKDLTPYLLVKFGEKLVVEPRGESRIYLKFPIDIGVFPDDNRESGNGLHAIDIFSHYPGKFTLYGDIRTGILCKYFKSDVYSHPPETNPVMEGVMELEVRNNSGRWAEISKAVFSAFDMKVFYHSKGVAMKAQLAVSDRDIAETSFFDLSPDKGMTRAAEYYVSRGLIQKSSGFVMEWGYGS